MTDFDHFLSYPVKKKRKKKIPAKPQNVRRLYAEKVGDRSYSFFIQMIVLAAITYPILNGRHLRRQRRREFALLELRRRRQPGRA